MTSKNIMELKEYDNVCIMYKATCSCLSPDHDLIISVEKDRETNSINLQFDVNVCFIEESLFDKKGKRLFTLYIKNMWNRFKKSLELLFTGYLEMNSTFIIDDEQQMKDFINSLIEGIEHLKVK
jgi:hypothetical protein